MSMIKKIFKLLVRGLKVLARLPGMLVGASSGGPTLSLPTRVALVVALVVLLLVVIVPIVGSYLDRPLIEYLGWLLYILLALFFLIAIPLVVYYTLRLWLEGDVSPFQDIDVAWKKGLEALDQNGLALRDIPIFLIVGSRGEAQDKALFEGARLAFRVEEPPQGGGWALRFYANPEAIYVVCTAVGCLSALNQGGGRILARQAAEPVAGPPGAVQKPRPVTETIVAPGTIDEEALEEQSWAQGAQGGSHDIRGTMVASGSGEDGGTSTAGQAQIGLDKEEQARENERLEHLCQLILRERHPICPINGLLTLLPYEIISKGPHQATQVQHALREDTATIRRVMRLRCPATAFVVGMEEESGFRELVRRVGSAPAQRQRFGKGFGVWNPPIPERIEALCAHACAAFEDWTYHLFSKKDALSRTGNEQLYLLLCKVRRDVQNRLTNIIEAGFANDPETNPSNDALLFTGCYFAATGDQPDRQAFIRAVFDKLRDQQGDLQWTEEALIQERRNAQIAKIILIIDLLLLLGLGALVGYIIL